MGALDEIIVGVREDLAIRQARVPLDRLKELWTQCMTASQIADELGGVSRNAVIGKAHRLGLEQRPSPVKPGEEKEAKKPAPAAAAPSPPKPGPAAKAEALTPASPAAARAAHLLPSRRAVRPGVRVARAAR